MLAHKVVFFNDDIFPKKYKSFFKPILVEPLPEQAKKLFETGYEVIPKGLWSTNCKKKLYVLDKRSGSSSMYKPSKSGHELYNFKKNDFSLFEISREMEIECTTIHESLKKPKYNSFRFFKIDTQGSELEILKGIGHYRPLAMRIEVQVVPMYENMPNWTELIKLLVQIRLYGRVIGTKNRFTHKPDHQRKMDVIFIPNYMTENGKKININKRERIYIFNDNFRAH